MSLNPRHTPKGFATSFGAPEGSSSNDDPGDELMRILEEMEIEERERKSQCGAEGAESAEGLPSASSAQSAPHRPSPKDFAKAIEAEEHLKQNTKLYTLYRKYMREGTRLPLKKRVSFLFRVLAPDLIKDLCLAHWCVNRVTISQSESDWEKALDAALENARETWEDGITEMEREWVESFDDRREAAFRICQDLAQGADSFFLSCDDLGSRLDCPSQSAWRILDEFQTAGIIKKVSNGERRTAGKKAKATSYKWLLPSSPP